MSAPTSTRVSFPAGAVSGTGRVVLVAPHDGRSAVVVDTTPFHPVDHSWPDQPADRGTLDGLPVLDCLTGAVGPDGVLAVGADLSVRRGDADHSWVVVHVVDEAPAVGAEVGLEVDPGYRTRLSAAHTGCHLSALAMNAETARFWTKDPERRDSLGHPDLDSLAITESRIGELESFDAYRFGKSLRKKGFDGAAFLAEREAVAAAVNARLTAWLATAAAVEIATDGDDTLTARRRWVCRLPEGEAALPCGGTHVTTLAALAEVVVRYTGRDDGSGLEVVTRVTPA